MIFAAESVTAERALKLAVAGVHHVMTLQIFARRKPFGALATLKLFFTYVTLYVGRRYCAAVAATRRHAVAGDDRSLMCLPVLHKT